MQKRQDLLPDFIPESLIEYGHEFHFSMSCLQPDSIAWNKEPLVEVIEALANHEYAILGGDVLELSEGRLEYTGDYWDVPNEDVVLWEEFVECAKEQSVAFVEDTSRRKDGSLLYAIFFINERSFKERMRNFGNIKYR